MKQLVIILMMMLCHSAFAQKGMQISALFDGKIVPSNKMVETRIRGKAISKYKLSYFHSVRFDADDALVKKIDHLTAQDFVNDTEKVKDRELASAGKGSIGIKGNSFTQMYELAPDGSTHRFLCYKVRDGVMTVIYLEGSVSSLAELKRIFND